MPVPLSNGVVEIYFKLPIYTYILHYIRIVLPIISRSTFLFYSQQENWILVKIKLYGTDQVIVLYGAKVD